MPYPQWEFYPARARPPAWVTPLIAAFTAAQAEIDSRTSSGITSDTALASLRPHLLAIDYEVETGKKKAEKIRRPVLFGELGKEAWSYEVDAFNPLENVALEIEAGRGARGNAVYRDLIETSLLVDAQYLALAVMLDSRHLTSGRTTSVKSYVDSTKLLDAIYASSRLVLPLQGILLIGY